MKLKTFLTAVLALRTACAAFAEWVPTGYTKIAAFPDMTGQNARTVTLQAQLAQEMVFVKNRRPTKIKRLDPLPGALVRFTMYPSGRPQRVSGITDAQGWARAKWEVPRYNQVPRIAAYANFDGAVINRIPYRRSQTAKAIIFVKP